MLGYSPSLPRIGGPCLVIGGRVVRYVVESNDVRHVCRETFAEGCMMPDIAHGSIYTF